MRRFAPLPVSRRRGGAADAVAAERNLPRRLVKLPVSALPITLFHPRLPPLSPGPRF